MKIFGVFFLALFMFVALIACDIALRKDERIECGELLKQEEYYGDSFYATYWEKEMCEQFNIVFAK